MQVRSNLWKELAATGNYRTETAAEIGGVTYASRSAPQVNRALCSDALSVGNCASATLSFSILTQNTIPKSAEIHLMKRLADDAGRFTEWLPAGTFFISKRKPDAVTGLQTFQCYDAMLKANTPYPVSDEADFPKTMAACILEIASFIGVDVDERTWDYIESGGDYVVPLPNGLTMTRVLGNIGAVHGGNWIISLEGKLLFVPLRSCALADDADDSISVDVRGVLGRVSIGESIVVSAVSISNGSDTFTAGDDTGYTLKISTSPYATQGIADDLLEKLGGLVYNPFTLDKAVYDPAVELGDFVRSKDNVRSVLYSTVETYNLAFRGNMSAPAKAELEDEYPHIGTDAKLEGLEGEIQQLSIVVADKASLDDLYAVTAMIENLSVSDIKTGIIHSSDYEVITRPYVYPGSAVYPSSNLYPSNGETVLKGFAIDFSTGTIYGAFYSEQIAALQASVVALNASIEALRNALIYPRGPDETPLIYPRTYLFPAASLFPVYEDEEE